MITDTCELQLCKLIHVQLYIACIWGSYIQYLNLVAFWTKSLDHLQSVAPQTHATTMMAITLMTMHDNKHCDASDGLQNRVLLVGNMSVGISED